LAGVKALELQRLVRSEEELNSESVAAVMYVLTKHGYRDKDIAGYLQLLKTEAPDDADTGLMQVGAVVFNKPMFFADAESAVKLLEAKSTANQRTEPSEDSRPNYASESELKDVKVTGNTAVGSVETSVDGRTEAQPIYFVKEDGSWKLAASEQEPDWKKPIQGRFLFQDKK
jgi:hypothetical protein